MFNDKVMAFVQNQIVSAVARVSRENHNQLLGLIEDAISGKSGGGRGTKTRRKVGGGGGGEGGVGRRRRRRCRWWWMLLLTVPLTVPLLLLSLSLSMVMVMVMVVVVVETQFANRTFSRTCTATHFLMRTIFTFGALSELGCTTPSNQTPVL